MLSAEFFVYADCVARRTIVVRYKASDPRPETVTSICKYDFNPIKWKPGVSLFDRAGGGYRRSVVRLRYGCRVGCRAGSRRFLPHGERLYLHGVDARFHGLQRPDRLRHRRCHIGRACRASGPQAHARGGGRVVLCIGCGLVVARKRNTSIRRGVVRAARVVQPLPYNRRHRRRSGIGRMPDVHSRDLARAHTRHAGLVQPVRHNIRHAGSIFRELSHTQQSGRYGRGHTAGYGRRRLAPHVPLGGVPCRCILPAHTAGARDTAFSGFAR